MLKTKHIVTSFLLSVCLLSPTLLHAKEIRVAVASNFIHVLKVLAHNFVQQTGYQVSLISGSTGRHYAQIINGAPFDIFFAADSKRPALLEKEKQIIPGSRYTYALGKLVLWSPNTHLVDKEGDVLKHASFHHLAMANPKLAPYGKAAQEVLLKKQLWKSLKTKAVRGENIAQAFQYVKSGNAELGFVALSQVKDLTGSLWEIPDSLYSPIQQDAVLLSNKKAALAFYHFVKSNEPQTIIKNFGYGIPH